MADAEDRAVAVISFRLALHWLEELKAAPKPLSYGDAARFTSMLSKREVQELYGERDPHWYAYAATMQEFAELLAATPKQPFVEKRRAKQA